MVRKLDLHEDAMFRYCGSADAIMGFEYAESARPIPIFADRCLRVDEPPPTTANCRSLNIFARRIGCFENNSVIGECASMTISAGDWPLRPKRWDEKLLPRSPALSHRRPCWLGIGS